MGRGRGRLPSTLLLEHGVQALWPPCLHLQDVATGWQPTGGPAWEWEGPAAKGAENPTSTHAVNELGNGGGEMDRKGGREGGRMGGREGGREERIYRR